MTFSMLEHSYLAVKAHQLWHVGACLSVRDKQFKQLKKPLKRTVLKISVVDVSRLQSEFCFLTPLNLIVQS